MSSLARLRRQRNLQPDQTLADHSIQRYVASGCIILGLAASCMTNRRSVFAGTFEVNHNTEVSVIRA